MSAISHRIWLSFVGTLACCATACHAQTLETETLLMTGSDAPGTEPGVTFLFFGPPVINDAGQMAFGGELAGPGVDDNNEDVIYALDDGGLTLVLRTGDPIADAGAGVTITRTDNIYISAEGHVAATGNLAGPGVSISSSSAAFVWDGASLGLFARQGDQAPGTEPGIELGNFYDLNFSGAGHASFYSILAGTDVGSFNNIAVYSGSSGDLRLVAREGDHAFGFDETTRYLRLDYRPVSNDAGGTVFRADVRGPETYSVIYAHSGGSLRIVARSGQVAPGIGAGLDVQLGIVEDPVINGSGHAAFHAVLVGEDADFLSNSGVFAETHHGLRLVSREGDAAPDAGSGTVFREYNNLIFNDAGQATFVATLDGASVNSTNDQALYTERNGALALIALGGEHAPGTEPGVEYRDFFYGASANAAGQVAFVGFLGGEGVSAQNNEALYVTTLDGEVRLIARERDLFDVNDDPAVEEWRTIAGVGFYSGSGGDDGRPTGLNDAGGLALRLSFTDGTGGLFLVDTFTTPSLIGDLTGDGLVGINDLDVLLANWGNSVGAGSAGYLSGDLSGDGLIGQSDLSILLNAWGEGELPQNQVPEPGGAAMLAIGGLALLRRRRG